MTVPYTIVRKGEELEYDKKGKVIKKKKKRKIMSEPKYCVKHDRWYDPGRECPECQDKETADRHYAITNIEEVLEKVLKNVEQVRYTCWDEARLMTDEEWKKVEEFMKNE